MASAVSSYLYKAAFGKQHTVKQSINNVLYLGRYEILKGLSYNDFFSISAMAGRYDFTGDN
jgi:hypothetical protein